MRFIIKREKKTIDKVQEFTPYSLIQKKKKEKTLSHVNC